MQVWLELDNLVNPDGPRGPGGAQGFFTEGDMPRALLALLPPPPASGGWPDGFGLARLADQMEQRARLERLVSGDGDEKTAPAPQSDAAAASAAFTRPGPDVYPARRRAARLSYAVWALLAGDGAPLQRVLETTSTAERLRFAILRIRMLTGRQLRPPGSGPA